MKTVTANMSIEINVDCPHCEHLINLLDESDTDGVAHDDECAVLKQAIPDGHWHEEHKKFKVDDVTCTNCKGSFNVKELEW